MREQGPEAWLRPARLSDLAELRRLEEASFAADRLSARSWRHMLTQAKAATLVLDTGQGLAGAVLLLFRRATAAARLYSIAVDGAFRGRGFGQRLVAAAEELASSRGCALMRLEIRPDNHASQGLFRACGYKQFAVRPDYYEDGAEAWCYEKALPHAPPADRRDVPYYQQTLEFTCGPAALMMAMDTLDPGFEPCRKLELRIWREATTVFMTSGHGGCSPLGLAIAAVRRGFGVRLYVSDVGVPFVDSVRSDEKKEVLRLVHEDMLEEAEALGIAIESGALTVAEIEAAFDAGAVPIILISSWRLYGEKAPHWIVVTGFDDGFVYAHDPYIDRDEVDKEPDPTIHVPIPRHEFERMTRYGKAALQAALLVGRSANMEERGG